MPPEEVNEVSLYQGFCFVSTWDYVRAAGRFETYLNSPADEYSKLVARVNLAASYLALERSCDAIALLDETISKAAALGADRLTGNCLEIRGQARLFRGEIADARADLDRAMSIFRENQIYDRLLVEKWYAWIEACEHNSVAPLMIFRRKAERHRHWETVREADFLALKIRTDQSRFDHLYFGTPMTSYRDRILRQLSGQAAPSYLWGDDSGMILDLATGRLNTSAELNSGKMIHRLISALVKDFYAPSNLGALFSELYPDAYFDAYTSPLRIRQLMSRARRWMRSHRIPLSIVHDSGFYRLIARAGFGIVITRDHSQVDAEATKWEDLKRQLRAGQTFSSEDACQLTGLSRSSFHRLAKWALSRGKIKRSGKGRAVRYILAA